MTVSKNRSEISKLVDAGSVNDFIWNKKTRARQKKHSEMLNY